MADNLVLNAGAGGATLATDDIAGIHYQLVKVVFGALDTATLVTTAAPMPVDLRADNLAGNLDINIAASGVTVTVDSELPAAAALADATANPTVPAVGTMLHAFNGTTWDRIRSSGTGQVQVALQNAIPAGANNIGDVDVLSSVTHANRTATGTITAVEGTVSVATNGVATAGIRVSGTWVATLVFEGSVDGTNFFALDAINEAADTVVTSITANANLFVAVGGLANFRLRASAFTSGTVTVDLAASAGTGFVRLGPTDVNIGNVDVASLPAGSIAATTALTGGGVESGALRVTLANDSTGVVSVDDNGASLTVDGTVSVSGTVTVDSELPAAAALADNTANPTVPGVGAFEMYFDGTNWNRARGDSTNGLLVNLGANNDVIQATAANLNAQVVGNVAHDGAESGNPVGVGATARTTNPTAVADGDRVRVFADDLGRLVTAPYAPRDRVAHNRITLTTTTETTLLAAGGVGVFRDLVSLDISNESATEVRIDIRDATAGTIRWSIDLAADGGGVVKAFPVPLTQATANNNWTAQLSAAVSTVYLTAVGVENN